jgi:pyruvate formate lyase activating enzyme
MLRQGIIFDIKRFSVNDGPGIRTTVFFKGCPLSCWWCHNPESQLCGPEVVERFHMLDGKKYNHNETIGYYTTVEEVMKDIEKDTVFYDTSRGGVTFSGGEPLFQPGFLRSLATTCKNRDIHTCLDTSGYCDPAILSGFFSIIDIFLFDIKVPDRDKHFRYTGVYNDRIWQNLSLMAGAGCNYIIRLPVIPGVNDSDKDIFEIINAVGHLPNRMKEVHLLPYHNLAKHKQERLRMHNKMDICGEVSTERLSGIAEKFDRIGYRVKIGG